MQSDKLFGFWKELRGYLKTEIDVGKPEKVERKNEGSGTREIVKVNVRVSNTAPSELDLPKIVFTGVGLSAARVSARGLSDLARWIVKKEREEVKLGLDGPRWKQDEKMQELLTMRFVPIAGEIFPDVTGDESSHGEVLFPGQIVIWQLEIPSGAIPSLQLRVFGTVSRRHLMHFEETLPMPEILTRPPLVDALRDFNAIEIHGALNSAVKSFSDLGNETQFGKIQAAATAITEHNKDIDATQKSLNDAFHKYEIPVFRAHGRAAFIYLDDVRKGLLRVRDAIAKIDSQALASATDDLKRLQSEAAQLNRATEELMFAHHITDKEVNYRYRGV